MTLSFLKVFRSHVELKIFNSLFTPPPRVVEGWISKRRGLFSRSICPWRQNPRSSSKTGILHFQILTGVVVSYHQRIMVSGQYYEFHQVLIFMIFGRTDLRKGVSGAKFDGEADFEVRSAVALQKPGQNNEKLKFRSEIFAEQKNFGVEKWNVGDRLKRVLAKFEADRSWFRGVNGRSKFRKKIEISNGWKIARLAPIWTKIW